MHLVSSLCRRLSHISSRKLGSRSATLAPCYDDSGLLRRFSAFSQRKSPQRRILQLPMLSQERKMSSLLENEPEPSVTSPSILEANDGRKFAVFDTTRSPKLKPYIIKRRLARMKTYEGSEKNIRHSPWRLNLVCQLAAGLPLQEALTQLEFCKKSMAPTVQRVLKRTSNLADIRDGLQMSQLEVAECFATKGRPLKRVKIMGRGRAGRMEHKHSHFRVVLREIDFKLRIYQASSLNQKKKWFLLQQQAKADAEAAMAEREERERLEREARKLE